MSDIDEDNISETSDTSHMPAEPEPQAKQNKKQIKEQDQEDMSSQLTGAHKPMEDIEPSEFETRPHGNMVPPDHDEERSEHHVIHRPFNDPMAAQQQRLQQD